MPREDDGLGESAMRRGLISAGQLADVRRELDERRARGERVSMRELLLERKLVDSFTMAVALGSGIALPSATPQLARYDVQEMLGHGAMAVVYRAVDREMRRTVAVKVLWQADATSPEMRERFVREARVAAGLAHPNVVAVYDAGEEGGRPYLVMELVEGGRSLREILDEGAELRAVVGLLEKAARGVGAAHRRGVVHRDLKPANILVAKDGEPKVSDFGLAHIVGGQTAVTRTGAAVGTPMYMSPEQVRGDAAAITPRADVYGLGAILYQALTSSPPHAASTIEGVLEKILAGDVIPPRRVNPRAPVELERVCLKALERLPERRYEDGTAFADDLRAYLEGRPVSARPPSSLRGVARATKRYGWVAAAVFALAAGTALAVALSIAIRRADESRAKLEGEAESERARRREETERAARAETQLAAVRKLESQRMVLDRGARSLHDAAVAHEEMARSVEAARREIEAASASAPELALGPHLLGRAWELLGWLDRAEEQQRAAIALDGALAPARVQLARLLAGRAFMAFAGSSQAQRDASRAEVSMLVAEAQRHAAAAREAGVDVGALDAYLACMAAYARGNGREIDRITGEAIPRFRGQEGEEELHLMSAMAGGAERIAGIERAVAIRPKHAQALWCRGNDRMNRRDYEAAIADYTAAIRVGPRLSQAWANRGVCRQFRKQYDEAVADFTEAIRIDPKAASPYNNRGCVRRYQKDYAGSLEDHTRAIELNPRSHEAYANRGLTHWALKEYGAAVADTEKALEVAPGDWAFREQVEEDLAAMRRDRDR